MLEVYKGRSKGLLGKICSVFFAYEGNVGSTIFQNGHCGKMGFDQLRHTAQAQMELHTVADEEFTRLCIDITG